MPPEKTSSFPKNPYEVPRIQAIVQAFLPSVLEQLPYAAHERNFLTRTDRREAVFPFDTIGLELRIRQTRVMPSSLAETFLKRQPYSTVDVRVVDYLEPGLSRIFHVMQYGIEVTGPNRYSGEYERRDMNTADIADFQATFDRIMPPPCGV